MAVQATAMTIRQFLAVVEIRTKVISASTYVLATLYTLTTAHEVHLLDALLLAVAVLCVDMGTTAFNTFYDYVRGVDTPKLTVEPGKVLVHEGVAPAHVFLISVGLYLIAAATGVAVAALSSWWILAAGVVSMLVGFLYNGGPLPISRTPLGELFAGGFLGSVLFLVVYAVHAGTVGWTAVIASLPSTLVIASVLTVNNTCDLEGDREAGRRTLSIVLGRTMATALIDLLIATAYVLVLVMTLRTPGGGILAGSEVPELPLTGALIVAVGMAITGFILVRMHQRGYDHTTKHPNMSAIMRVVVVFTLTYGAVLVLGAAGV